MNVTIAIREVTAVASTPSAAAVAIQEGMSSVATACGLLPTVATKGGLCRGGTVRPPSAGGGGTPTSGGATTASGRGTSASGNATSASGLATTGPAPTGPGSAAGGNTATAAGTAAAIGLDAAATRLAALARRIRTGRGHVVGATCPAASSRLPTAARACEPRRHKAAATGTATSGTEAAASRPSAAGRKWPGNTWPRLGGNRPRLREWPSCRDSKLSRSRKRPHLCTCRSPRCGRKWPFRGDKRPRPLKRPRHRLWNLRRGSKRPRSCCYCGGLRCRRCTRRSGRERAAEEDRSKSPRGRGQRPRPSEVPRRSRWKPCRCCERPRLCPDRGPLCGSKWHCRVRKRPTGCPSGGPGCGRRRSRRGRGRVVGEWRETPRARGSRHIAFSSSSREVERQNLHPYPPLKTSCGARSSATWCPGPVSRSPQDIDLSLYRRLPVLPRHNAGRAQRSNASDTLAVLPGRRVPQKRRLSAPKSGS